MFAPHPFRRPYGPAAVRSVTWLIAALGTTGCGPTEPSDPISVFVSPTQLTLPVGATELVLATVQNGSTERVTWSTSQPTIATVDSNGMVRGVGPGQAVVRATSVEEPTQSASALVTVEGPTCSAPGGSVSLGSSRAGSLSADDCATSDGHYYETWRLVLSASTAISIDLTSGDFDAVLSLVQNGSVLETDDDGGGGLNSRIEAMLAAGAYELHASTFLPGETGAYSLAASSAGGGSGGGGPGTVSIIMTNRLLNTINVTVNGSVVGSVPPSETRSTSVPRPASLNVEWDLVRSTTTQGTPVGDVLGGTFQPITNPGATVSLTVDAVVGDTHIFTPVIVNTTSTTLLMGVNEGLQSQNRCNCTVAGSSSGVRIGYYRLYSNSNVRAYRSSVGYSGSYIYWDSFATNVSPVTGAITLRATSAPQMAEGLDPWFPSGAWGELEIRPAAEGALMGELVSDPKLYGRPSAAEDRLRLPVR